jgi:hypothetical protein
VDALIDHLSRKTKSIVHSPILSIAYNHSVPTNSITNAFFEGDL